MRQTHYQPVLFDLGPQPITHFFYTTTNSITVKAGMAANVEKRMRRDGQFKGHVLIWRRPCGCVPHLVNGRRKCEQELAWERAHAEDRLPGSEQYRPSEEIKATLYWMARSSLRAMAVMDWLERHSVARTA